jgi:hypothetical protein
MEKENSQNLNDSNTQASQSETALTATQQITQNDKKAGSQGEPTTTKSPQPTPTTTTKKWKISSENTSFWDSVLDQEEDSEDDAMDDSTSSNPEEAMTGSSMVDNGATEVGKDVLPDESDDDDDTAIPNLANLPSLFDASQIGNMDFEALLPDDDDDED